MPATAGPTTRDGVHQIFFAHHVDQERLARGNIESVDHAEQSG
jgi:hypothetical protein